MFRAFVLPRLPAKHIRKINFAVSTAQKPPSLYLTWRELLNFTDMEKMPNVDRLCIQIDNRGSFKFDTEQIGDVLDGLHDDQILEWLRRELPPVRSDQRQEKVAVDGRRITFEVQSTDRMSAWAPDWQKAYPEDTEARMVCYSERFSSESMSMK